MKNKVLDTIKKYNLICPGDKIVLGVSGGPDSICMLYILNDLKKDLNFEIIVAHINHKIREEADEEEEFVRYTCENLKIEFYSKSIDVKQFANNNKIGTEEAGRKIRYNFFEEVLNLTNANKIAIAHNKNDNVETVLMHILRGTGISGLKGIEPIKGDKFIRPLIECQRDEIEKYCEDNNLQPRIDKTNFENIYTRNKVRNLLIPYIKKEFNPNIIETITRLSDLIREEDEYMQEQVRETYREIRLLEENNQIIVNLKEFNKQDRAIKTRLVMYIITKLFGSSAQIEKIHIYDIIKLCNNNIGNKYLTPNKNIKILVKGGKIYFIKQI